MAKHTLGRFHYGSRADIIEASFVSILAIVITIIFINILPLINNVLSTELPKILSSVWWQIYACVSLYCLCTCIVMLTAMYAINLFIAVHLSTCHRMIITSSEVIYKCGWYRRNTVTIPLKQIISCEMHYSALQKKCSTMDLLIFTNNKHTIIEFHNIKNGEEAYHLITKSAFAHEN